MELLRDAVKLGVKYGRYEVWLLKNYMKDTEKLRAVDWEFSSSKEEEYFFNKYIKDFPKSKSFPIHPIPIGLNSGQSQKGKLPTTVPYNFTAGKGLDASLNRTFRGRNVEEFRSQRKQEEEALLRRQKGCVDLDDDDDDVVVKPERNQACFIQ